MEAPTSSCSMAMVERPGSYSPISAAYVSIRPEFCLSQNDKKGCNFRFLKLVQNMGIYPVQAVSSKTEVDLDSVELQAQQTIKFQLQESCNFGDQFLIVGDDPMFGSWDPSNALPMTWSDGHIWTIEQDIPAGKSIQFKFILKRKEGDIIWQPSSDRFIHTWESMNRITLYENWENAQLQKIIEEDQLAHSNEEHQFDSEMSTSADNSGHSKFSGIEDRQTHAMDKPPTLARELLDSVTLKKQVI